MHDSQMPQSYLVKPTRETIDNKNVKTTVFELNFVCQILILHLHVLNNIYLILECSTRDRLNFDK